MACTAVRGAAAGSLCPDRADTSFCGLAVCDAERSCRRGAQGGTEVQLSDEGRVMKFNSRYGGLGAYGKPGPVTPGGDKKLEYKKPVAGKKGKKGGKK